MTPGRWIIAGALIALSLPRAASAQETAPAPAPAPANPSPPAAATPTLAPTRTPFEADRGASSGDPLEKPAEYRSGVVFGATLGVGSLDVSGYPNSATALGDPAYKLSSGPVFGFANRFFLMGALADTFNFGVWFGGMSGQTSSTKASASGGGFRVEAFPLYSVSPALRDLGFIAQFGVGTAVAESKDKPLSVDGTESFLGAGALYELSRNRFIGLKAVTGITLEYQFITSQSIASHGALLGARIAFYGGP